MSLNHYYSEIPSSAVPGAGGWWSEQKMESPDHGYLVPAGGIFCVQKSSPVPPFTFNLNLNKDEEDSEFEHEAPPEEWLKNREVLFEKPLTPSDVGKLNRLVIPKQHAERNFPMNCGGDSCENGVILSFLDEIGKPWRFRYSYWNSSQSYVLTKGWSRFVKEKRLDAGDVVTFSRHRSTSGRLFIGWRRRNPNSAPTNDSRGISKNPGPSSGVGESCQVTEKEAIRGNSLKTVRLFGVNLEYHGDTPTPIESTNSGSQYHEITWYTPYFS